VPAAVWPPSPPLQAIEYGLAEEAFEIYKKFGRKVEAVQVLLRNVGDLDRAHDYANKVDEPAVWSELGNAYLEQNMVSDAIACYLRSQDATKYVQVGGAASGLVVVGGLAQAEGIQRGCLLCGSTALLD
jgi:clathrin heavy chain